MYYNCNVLMFLYYCIIVSKYAPQDEFQRSRDASVEISRAFHGSDGSLLSLLSVVAGRIEPGRPGPTRNI